MNQPAESIKYDDRRWTLPLVLVGLAVIGYVKFSAPRQWLDCSRSLGVCVVQQQSFRYGSWRRDVPLASVVGLKFYKVEEQSKRALQGLELQTASTRIQLTATQPCAPGEVPCPGDQADAVRSFDRFLKDRSLASVHVEYGIGRHFGTIVTFFCLFVLASLLGWIHVEVGLAVATRRVVVKRRRSLFFVKRYELPLDAVRSAVLASTRMGTKRSYAVELVLDDRVVTLVQGPTRIGVAERFVDQLNAAFVAARGATAWATPRATVEALASPAIVPELDPIVIESSYRSATWLVLGAALAINLLMLLSGQRHELECSRSARLCWLSTRSLFGTDRRSVPLDAIVGVALYKLEAGKSGSQGLELLTQAAPEALPASEHCAFAALTHFCVGDSSSAHAAAQAFFANESVEHLAVGYGAVGESLPTLNGFFGFVLFCTLLHWQSFRISISAASRSVSVVRRRALVFVRHFELELGEVEEASLNEQRDDEKAVLRHRAALHVRYGPPIWLNRAWSDANVDRTRLVSTINAALTAARARAVT